MRLSQLNVIKHAKVAELTKKHSNLPERYIKRCLERVLYKAPKLPQYRQITVKKLNTNFGVERPWEIGFMHRNMPWFKEKNIDVEPIKDWKVFRGDRVEILTGKDKGKHGIVCEIIQERNWVFVEGLNLRSEIKGKTDNFPGVLVRVEAPLMVTTDISLVDPGDLKPCKVKWKYTEEGTRVRVSDRSGRILPISHLEDETYDYKTRESYQEHKKDTLAQEVAKITFEPKLQTFEMNIMEEQGIQEDRVPAKSYWY